MGNRIAVMHGGKLQQLGTPLEVYEKPVNIFVAQFIGTPPMNFLSATVGAAGATLDGPGFSLPVPASLKPAVAGAAGKSLRIGLRPEHVLEADKPARGQAARLELVVEMVETTGDQVIAHGKLGQGDDLIAFKLDAHRGPQFGEKIPVRVELDALHLFDAQTERRLNP